MDCFFTMPPRSGICTYCRFDLDDGSALLGHDDHVFHQECILKKLRETPVAKVPCPEKCGFVATHINGTGIPIILKQMGVKRTLQQPLRGQSVSPCLERAGLKKTARGQAMAAPVSPAALKPTGIKRSLAYHSFPDECPLQPEMERQDRVFALEVALVVAEKNYTHLQILLGSGGYLSSKSCGEALIAIAESGGEMHFIDLLLKHGVISSSDLGKAAQILMNKGNFFSFQRLLASGQLMDPESLTSCVHRSIEIHQLPFLRELLAYAELDPMSRGTAVNLALKLGAFDMALELLPPKATISGNYIVQIFSLAADLGRSDILRLLLDGRQPIPLKGIQLAIQHAQKRKFVEIAAWLEEIRRTPF